MKKLKQYVGLDYFKIFAIFMVIGIHTIKVDSILDYQVKNIIFRVAVPLYLAISSFLLFKKLFELKEYGKKKEIIKKYIKKLSWVYVIWNIIYSPLIIRDIILKEKFNLQGITVYIIRFFTSSTYMHLWFLIALIYGNLLMFLLIYKYKITFKKISIYILILYIVSIILTTYSFIFNRYDLIGKFNSILGGRLLGSFMFTYIGVICAKYQNKLKFNKFLFVLSLILLFIEGNIIRYFNGKYYDLYISLIPLTYYFFVLLIKISYQFNINFNKIRKTNLEIFLIHMYFVVIIVNTFKILNISFIGIEYVEVFLVYMCSYVASAFIMFIKDKLINLIKLYKIKNVNIEDEEIIENV